MFTKKTLIIFTIFALIFSAVIPQISGTKEKNMSMGILDNIRIYKNFTTTTNIGINEEDIPNNPIEINKSNEIPISVSFEYTTPRFYPNFLTNLKLGNFSLGSWILFRDAQRKMSVNISLSLTKPEWCEAKLTKNDLTINLSTEGETKKTILNFKIKNGTGAFKEGTISLKAEFTPLENWGLKASEDTTSIEIISEYQGTIDLNYTYPNNETINTKPGKNITFPVTIKNTGNGETRATISLDNLDDRINVSIEPETLVIAKGSEKTIDLNLSISRKEESYLKTLNFTVISESTSDLDLDKEHTVGETENFSIDIKVVKHKEEDHYGNLLIILGVLIAILLLIGIIVKIIKRK